MAAVVDAKTLLFDEAIKSAERLEWKPEKDKPFMERVDEGPSALSFENLPLRSVDEIKTVYTMFDIQRSVHVELTAEDIANQFIESGFGGLPEILRPPVPPPIDAKFQLFMRDVPGGTVDVVVHYM